MPTYEYRCKACGHELEVQQSFTDEALTECPECQGSLRKVYGNVGIAFKGSGFYKNDARKSSGSKTATSTSASTDSTSTSSSDSSSSATSTDTTKTSDTKATPAKTSSPSSD